MEVVYALMLTVYSTTTYAYVLMAHLISLTRVKRALLNLLEQALMDLVSALNLYLFSLTILAYVRTTRT